MTDWWSSVLHLPFVAMNLLFFFFFFRNALLLPFPKIRLRPGLRFLTLILVSLSSLTMEEADHAATSSSSAAAIDRRASGDASSSSIFHVREEEDDRLQHIHEVQHSESEEGLLRISFRGTISAYEEASSLIRDDTWSCAVVVLTFWFFVSLTLILGVYGSTTIWLGPNTSILLQPNPIFVQYVKIEELNNLKAGLRLYGFYKAPPLDTWVTWSDTRNVSVATDSHQEWAYFLNEGSQIDISYTVNSPSSSIFLIIADGNDGLAQWLENPTYPNTTLSWNVVHGSGNIQLEIYKPSNYYVAVGNLNSEEVEVQLNLNVRAVLYNTTNAYYKCTFTSGTCGLSVMFPGGNSVLITSPDPEQAALNDGWDIKMSYGPRWATYVLGTGGMTILMLLAFNFVNKFQFTREDETRGQHAEGGSERAPLLSVKDDDLSSWGSSYDSASHDEEDFEQLLARGSLDGKPVKDGEIANNTRRLCAICFDAPRDCFFLPCGHCVACFECGSRIAEVEGICPVCRRNMKKVRRIFTV